MTTSLVHKHQPTPAKHPKKTRRHLRQKSFSNLFTHELERGRVLLRTKAFRKAAKQPRNASNHSSTFVFDITVHFFHNFLLSFSLIPLSLFNFGHITNNQPFSFLSLFWLFICSFMRQTTQVSDIQSIFFLFLFFSRTNDHVLRHAMYGNLKNTLFRFFFGSLIWLNCVFLSTWNVVVGRFRFLV